MLGFMVCAVKLCGNTSQQLPCEVVAISLWFVFQDGKIEAEDFTSRLYRELNSSPQPYLVPFLKVIEGLCCSVWSSQGSSQVPPAVAFLQLSPQMRYSSSTLV
jgi:hypothetical protein